MLPAPRTKAEFYRRYREGEFGNSLRSWATLGELRDSRYSGTVTARNRTPGKKCLYGVPAGIIHVALLNNGLRPEDCSFNESAPDDRLLIQGELARAEKGLYLYYSTAQTTMREALSAGKGRHAYGLEAASLLKSRCNAVGYDMLMDLLDLYDTSVRANDMVVVEFGVYENCLGCCKSNNVIIWEVRAY
jgi:hypothetical protein